MLALVSSRIGERDRLLHAREEGERLLGAVLEDLEVLLRQIADVTACLP